MSKNILTVKGLSKVFGDFYTLKEITMNLKQGEIFGLLGENGAGKTTFISIITGLLEASSGSAYLYDIDLVKNIHDAKKHIGLVPQEMITHGFFTVNQILDFHSGYYGIQENRQHVNFLLNKLALYDKRDQLVSQLSGGMKRRLLIAKALVHSPPLLLLDEPTAGVDVELRNTLWQFVRELNRKGTTILLTTHYLQEAEELCDRIGVLHHGELIAEDLTKNLIEKMTERHITFTIDPEYVYEKTPIGVQKEGNTLTKIIPNHYAIGEVIQELRLPLEKIKDIQISEGSLEDAFVALINGKT